MATDEKRAYVGHGKRVQEYDLINFSVCLSDIPTQSVFEYKGKTYVKLCIGAKKAPDQYGKTHSIWIDTFTPQQDKEKRAYGAYKSEEESNQERLNNMVAKDDAQVDAPDASDIPF